MSQSQITAHYQPSKLTSISHSCHNIKIISSRSFTILIPWQPVCEQSSFVPDGQDMRWGSSSSPVFPFRFLDLTSFESNSTHGVIICEYCTFFLSHHIPFCYQLMQWPTFLMCYYKCVYNPGITSRVSNLHAFICLLMTYYW